MEHTLYAKTFFVIDMYEKLVLTIIFAAFSICCLRFVRDIKHGKAMTMAAAAVYICAILYLTLFSRAGSVSSRISFKLPLPFWIAIKRGHYGLVTNRSVLNVLLFVPFGYLVRSVICVFKLRAGLFSFERIKLWHTAILGLFASLLIETAQFVFSRGVFELDDLVKNTLGAVIGHLIYSLLNNKKPRQTEL